MFDNIPKKETLYKTAFSPMHQMYLGIKSSWIDTDGQWIFKGKLENGEEHFFRKNELENFVL
jgi:hypothetical protein